MNDVEIRRVTLFSGDGFGRAGVTFRMGPVLVRGAKIFEKEGNRWLSMPGRKNGNGEWIDTVFIEDLVHPARRKKSWFAGGRIDFLQHSGGLAPAPRAGASHRAARR